MREKALIALTIVGLTTAAFGIYRWLDAAVSLDYARQENQRKQERGQLMKVLLEATARPMTHDELVTVIRDLPGQHVVKQEGDVIEVDGLIVELKNGRLTAHFIEDAARNR